jgi:hypothetical protein
VREGGIKDGEALRGYAQPFLGEEALEGFPRLLHILRGGLGSFLMAVWHAAFIAAF